MSSTLGDRIKERMEALGINNAQLAKASGVKQPTSFNWANGRTKQIKGEPLLKAAQALGVAPGWLATGTGPKFPTVYSSTAQEPAALYCLEPVAPQETLQTSAVTTAFETLPPAGKAEVLQHLAWVMEKYQRADHAKNDPETLLDQLRKMQR